MAATTPFPSRSVPSPHPQHPHVEVDTLQVGSLVKPQLTLGRAGPNDPHPENATNEEQQHIAVDSSNDTVKLKVQPPKQLAIAAVADSSVQPFVDNNDMLLLESNLTDNLMAATQFATEELKNMIVNRSDPKICSLKVT